MVVVEVVEAVEVVVEVVEAVEAVVEVVDGVDVDEDVDVDVDVDVGDLGCARWTARCTNSRDQEIKKG